MLNLSRGTDGPMFDSIRGWSVQAFRSPKRHKPLATTWVCLSPALRDPKPWSVWKGWSHA
jgi:hypothetical protein